MTKLLPFLIKLLFYIRVQLFYNIVLVSDIQQSGSVVRIHISVLFQIIFPYSLLQNIE